MLQNATKAAKQLILCAKIRHRNFSKIECDAVRCSCLLQCRMGHPTHKRTESMWKSMCEITEYMVTPYLFDCIANALCKRSSEPCDCVRWLAGCSMLVFHHVRQRMSIHLI